MTANSFGSRAALDVAGTSYQIHRLDAVAGAQDLPFSLKILLENLLRDRGRRQRDRRSRPRPGRVGPGAPSPTPRSRSARPG